MKPSTLAALVSGDIVNALISETPGGIEAQEAQGQKNFVASETLPIECIFCTREQLEQMGILFGEEVDDLFVEVQLPEGWKKVPTSHSMWSKLLDGQGRERASIFYKAAFYDRSAHIGLVNRFSARVEPVDGWDDPDYYTKGRKGCVKDGETIMHVVGEIGPEPQGDREAFLAWLDEKDRLGTLAQEWLDEHYPNWRDPLAYWEGEE